MGNVFASLRKSNLLTRVVAPELQTSAVAPPPPPVPLARWNFIPLSDTSWTSGRDGGQYKERKANYLRWDATCLPGRTDHQAAFLCEDERDLIQRNQRLPQSNFLQQ